MTRKVPFEAERLHDALRMVMTYGDRLMAAASITKQHIDSGNDDPTDGSFRVARLYGHLNEDQQRDFEKAGKLAGWSKLIVGMERALNNFADRLNDAHEALDALPDEMTSELDTIELPDWGSRLRRTLNAMREAYSFALPTANRPADSASAICALRHESPHDWLPEYQQLRLAQNDLLVLREAGKDTPRLSTEIEYDSGIATNPTSHSLMTVTEASEEASQLAKEDKAMLADISSVGRLAPIVGAVPARIERAAQELGVKVVRINGIAHFSDEDLERIREHLTNNQARRSK